MVRSRRPELEKDNPAAPEVYARRRRRRASGQDRLPSDALDTLQSLTEAAESYLNRMPLSKKNEAERRVLLDAITRAQLLLSIPDQAEVGS